MAKFELTGKIEKLSSIMAVPTKSGSINKREVILTILRYDPNTGEPTGEPNHVAFEFSGERDVPKLEAYKEGDMVTVAFYLSGRNYTGKDNVERNFTKVVGYDINPSTMQFSVQGRYLGQVFAEDREGNAMPAHYGKHVVPSRDFLPVGTSPRSFDGRYTGTVPMHHIRAKVIPVVTIR